MARESVLISHIQAYVKMLGGKTIKIHQSGFSEVGIPDLICVLPGGPHGNGLTFFCETKAPGKKPTPIQLAKITEINKAGGHAFWTDSFSDFCKKKDRLML